MNKKLMALGLVIGLSFFQIPVRANGACCFISSSVTTLCMLIKEHPVYTVFAAESILVAFYFIYYDDDVPQQGSSDVTEIPDFSPPHAKNDEEMRRHLRLDAMRRDYGPSWRYFVYIHFSKEDRS